MTTENNLSTSNCAVQWRIESDCVADSVWLLMCLTVLSLSGTSVCVRCNFIQKLLNCAIAYFCRPSPSACCMLLYRCIDLCMLAAQLDAAFGSHHRPPIVNGYCTLPRRPCPSTLSQRGGSASHSSQQWLSLTTAGALMLLFCALILISGIEAWSRRSVLRRCWFRPSDL